MLKSTLALAAFVGLIVLAGPGLASDQTVDTNHPEEHTLSDGAKDADYCAKCHTCPEPTREHPCLVDCPRHAGKFFGVHRADEGPEVIVIDQLANLYEPVVFAHRLHADMSDMGGGCENCHHYSEPDQPVPPCRECHQATRATVDLNQPALKGAYHRQCMNCHRDWSHDNACAYCHAEASGDPAAVPHDPTDIVGLPHPLIEATASYIYETSHEEAPVVSFHHEDHVEMFGLSCVDCHQGDSCARCHDTSTQAESAPIDHVKTCGTCHAERDCNFCHATEPRPMFEHTSTVGWALAPHHVDVKCQTCHGQPKAFRTPSDRCTACHIHWEVGSFDHGVTGLALSDDHVDLDCDSCHLDQDFSVRPSCVDCHDDEMLPDNLPGERVGKM